MTTFPRPRPATPPAEGPNVSDETLMRRIAAPEAGPEEIGSGVEALAVRHAKAVWRYFVRRGEERHEAEDLVQEVFLRVLRERAKWDRRQAFRPWFFTLARNVWLSRGRKRRTEARALNGYAQRARARRPAAAETGNVGKEAAQAEECERVCRALEALPEGEREVLRLARFEELSFAQIGAMLHITPGAAKVRAFRALEKLRAALKRSAVPPPSPSGPGKGNTIEGGKT